MSELYFETLTPKNNLENIETYKKALDFVIESDDIKNVAITGVYGSGKTSIIETYKKHRKPKWYLKCKRYKFIHISLANFQNVKKDNESNEVTQDNKRNSESTPIMDAKTLEGKILNQLLHQISSKKIPQTIFRVKNDYTKRRLLLIWILSLYILMSCLYLIFFKNWRAFAINSLLVSEDLSGKLELMNLYSGFEKIIKISISSNTWIIILFFTLVIFSGVIFKIVHKQLNGKLLKKLSFNKAGVQTDIEIFRDSNDSYFDKYLDDVIYLFNNAEANIFVFEDIDRFESNIIFAKLKEINTIINKRRKNKNKVTFIYLLKDDMFISKERTKFFDFLIPVIPVINATNSYEILTNLLEQTNLSNELDKYFLQEISLYIDDMRLLKNIYNEFVIYKEKLNTNNLLDNNKLFAMIAYKNVFPNDFSDLQQGKGFVYQVFLNKKKYLKEENKKLSSEILDLRNKIYVSEETLLKSIDELYAVYFKSKIGNYFNFKINDKTESDFEDRISFIKALRENPDKVLAQRQSYLGFESYSLEGVFEEIEKNLEFLKRKESVISKEKIKLYQQKISNIELSQSELNSIKLAKVIKRSHLEDLTHDHFTNKSEEFMLIKSSESFDLLVFIIRNGYIDEGYEDYLTYFYPFSITLSDKKYLRSIIDERRLAWDYKIANIDEVFERIHTEYFLVESSLNYDVFKYLLANQNIVGRSNSLRNVFHTIDDTNNLNFLVNVFNIAGSDFKNILIKEWISYSPKLFNNLLSDALYDTVDKVNILIKMFEEITFDDLNMINNNLLTNYIENTEMFLEKVSDFNRSFEESLINLGIKFKEIPFLKINRDVIDFLYQNNLYDINAHNVNGFLLNMFDLTNEYDIKHKNFTLIFNNEKTILGKYILNNIEVYLESYLELSNGMTDDDVSAIYSLLNNEDVSENQKVSYVETINHMNVGIKYVDDFAMKTSLIELNKVKANELNILEYFHSNDNKWSDELIEFVNNNESEIEFRKDVLEEKYEKTSIIDFIKLTVKESRISDTAFDNIFSSIGKIYSEGFNVEGISETKMDILINKELISFSKKNLLVIRKLYPNKVVLFISKHLDFYLSIAGDDSVYNKDELIKVLDDNHDESIARTRKIVDLIETPIPIELKEYNYKLLNYILKNNFTEEDLEYLGVQYDTFTKTTKNIIVNIFVDKIQLTLSQKIDINLTLLNRLLSKETVKIESRQLLFSRSIFKFKKEELRHKFELLLLANYIDVIDNVRRKVKFPNNEINRNIIIYLDENGIISSFSKDELYYYVNSKAKKVHRI